MIRKILSGSGLFLNIILIISFTLMIFETNLSSASEIIPLSRLIRTAKKFDGHQIAIQAEVVGDLMVRRKGIWLNVDDSTKSIGVWVSKGFLPRVDFIGHYKAKGDILLIDGIFNQCCQLHGGETDIHALHVKRIHEGYPIEHPIPAKKLYWTLILFILAIVVSGIYWYRNQASK